MSSLLVVGSGVGDVDVIVVSLLYCIHAYVSYSTYLYLKEYSHVLLSTCNSHAL